MEVKVERKKGKKGKEKNKRERKGGKEEKEGKKSLYFSVYQFCCTIFIKLSFKSSSS